MLVVTLRDYIDSVYFRDFEDFRIKWKNLVVKPRHFLVFNDLFSLEWVYDPLVSTYNYKLKHLVMIGHGFMGDLNVYVLPDFTPRVSELVCKTFETAAFVSLISGDLDFEQFEEAFNNLCTLLQDFEEVRLNGCGAYLYSYKSSRKKAVVWKG